MADRIRYVILGRSLDGHLCRVGKSKHGKHLEHSRVADEVRKTKQPGWSLYLGRSRERLYHPFSSSFEANELAARLEEESSLWSFSVAPVGVRGGKDEN